jgi:hypothetical protein
MKKNIGLLAMAGAAARKASEQGIHLEGHRHNILDLIRSSQALFQLDPNIAQLLLQDHNDPR